MSKDKSDQPSSVDGELKTMYEADQGDRVGPNALVGDKANDNWAQLRERDQFRHKRLQELLAEGKVTSGDDYYHAAMILQHGSGPEDYLLAHILAGAAAQRGCEQAKWLAAASLDRYLQAVGQPQVFGTQYMNSFADKSWTQEPFSPALLSDSVRQGYNVPSLAEIRQRLKDYQSKDEHR
jgi:hypothetical protein